jgi:hypothetical protein
MRNNEAPETPGGPEYGELMSFLLYFRERHKSDEEFREFVLESLRCFVYDLRDFDVEISLASRSQPPRQTQEARQWRPSRVHAVARPMK